MNFKRNYCCKIPAIISGDDNINNLGVARALGRHGVPIILLSSNRRDIVRYSRYTSEWLKFPDPMESEDAYIDFLLNLGRQTEEKCIIIPTNDAAVMALSRYKDTLEPYFYLLFPEFEIVEKFVNKKMFYQLLGQLSIPHPMTYFPEDLYELKNMGENIEFPYIIKPAYMHVFRAEFRTKNFYVDSLQKLDYAIKKLENKNIEVFIQEILPGNEHYSLLTYFNRNSDPYGICGWDKKRQDPPFFGNSSVLCKSIWREEPIDLAIKTLQATKYYGIAEPEFKKDPKDNKYKLLEINARISVPNALPAKCGTDITHIAYLDTIGLYGSSPSSPQSGILWIDEINDLRICVKQVLKREMSILDLIKSLKGKKVYATAAWDDPLPLIVSVFHAGRYYIRKISKLLNIKKLFKFK